MILLVATAWAGSLFVVVRAEDGALGGAAARVVVTDPRGGNVQINMGDQGTPPDAAEGDGVWTGHADQVGDGPYTILVSDGGDARKWTGTFAADGDPPLVALRIRPGGAVEALARDDVTFTPVAQPGPPTSGGPPPEGPGVGGGGGAEAPPDTVDTTAATVRALGAFHPARLAAWVLFVGWAGWALAGARRASAVAVEPLSGERPTLPGRGVVSVRGDAAALTRALAGPFRVVLAGEGTPPPVPDGTVFPLADGPASVDDLAALLRGLDHHGPPLVVVVARELVAPGVADGAKVRRRLAGRLPSGVNAYVFGAPDPTFEVGPDGALRAIA